MALAPDTEAALERGRALFNAARFYEAHEAWEEAWLREQGDVRLLLQGLIQVAAGYVKALDHLRPGGAARLFAAAEEKLAPLPDGFVGLALDPLRAEVARSRAEVERWLAGERSGLDRALVPRLERAPPLT